MRPVLRSGGVWRVRVHMPSTVRAGEGGAARGDCDHEAACKRGGLSVSSSKPATECIPRHLSTVSRIPTARTRQTPPDRSTGLTERHSNLQSSKSAQSHIITNAIQPAKHNFLKPNPQPRQSHQPTLMYGARRDGTSSYNKGKALDSAMHT